MSKKQENQGGIGTVKQLRRLPNGVMTCLLEHQGIQRTLSTFTWNGPKLNSVWPDVLAFFRWTNDTMQSESQVRLYINVRTRQWKAWAFPQKANLRMSAKELTEGDEGYERTIEQRAMFPDPDWYYWGTVHHHCNVSAFQSGADQNNEVNQEGLHITVGNLNTEQFDIHARLYIDRLKLVFKLSDFWDIGDVISSLPPHIKRLVQPNSEDEMAKLQMGAPPAADQTFPEIWKENVIDCTPKTVEVINPSRNDFSNVNNHSYGMSFPRCYTSRGKPNFDMDLRRAASQIVGLMEHPQSCMKTLDDVINTLNHIMSVTDDEILDLMDVLTRNDVLPGNMVTFLEGLIKKGREMKDQQPQKQHHGKATVQAVLGLTESQQEKDQRDAMEEYYGRGHMGD